MRGRSGRGSACPRRREKPTCSVAERRPAYAAYATAAVATVGWLVLAGDRASAERPRSVEPSQAERASSRMQPLGREVPTAELAPASPSGPDDASAESTSVPPADNGAACTRASAACPADMVLVEGAYCTKVRQHCLHWLDDRKLPYARCGQYEKPARCVGEREKLSFCIDRYEQTLPGESLPVNYMSYTLTSKLCHRLGRRICLEKEWIFACEGEKMQPYPYGWSRQPICNQDHEDLYERHPKQQVLRDLREGAAARPQCASPFGVVNMVGNLDEPVLREIARYNKPFRNALKGGWWMAGRNRCRPATVGHDDYYRDIQIGARCCKDADP
jgi:sulfatase modifying factor 1